MKDIAARAAITPQVVGAMSQIVRGTSGRDPLAQAQAIRKWMARHVIFQRDAIPPNGGDLLLTPTWVLMQIAEHGIARIDCEDVSMLGAAIGKAAGIPARFVVLAFEDGAPFSHVFTELDVGEKWLDLDVTETAQTRSYFQPVRKVVLSV